MAVVAKIGTNLALSQPEGSGDRSSLACLVTVARHSGVHLSVAQLIHDNVLTGQQVSTAQFL